MLQGIGLFDMERQKHSEQVNEHQNESFVSELMSDVPIPFPDKSEQIMKRFMADSAEYLQIGRARHYSKVRPSGS